MIAGPLTDESDIRGVLIFRAQSVEEAKAWANADPAVTSGHLIVEMHPCPAKAVSDGAQSLDIPGFHKMMKDLQPYIGLWKGAREAEMAVQ